MLYGRFYKHVIQEGFEELFPNDGKRDPTSASITISYLTCRPFHGYDWTLDRARWASWWSERASRCYRDFKHFGIVSR